MPTKIEDYALIGDTQTAALVGKDGAIDWLCLPRFDSDACFAALLGDERHGRWRISPVGGAGAVRRRYLPGSLVLETEMDVAGGGAVRLIDFMPPRGHEPDVARIVEGVRGEVTLELELVIRFGNGAIVPWVRRIERGQLLAVAGPDALVLHTPVPTHGEGLRTVAQFVVKEGQRLPFILTWYPSHEPPPPELDAERQLDETLAYWREWTAVCTYAGEYRDEVLGSLRVLKALTYGPTGAIIAAPTTSLPEHLGGQRNWDYRYVWLRDATMTLYALMLGGYREEAVAWREWLLRAVAGDASKLQIMYGVRGERRLTERELPWLPGYASSRPVRVGNDAHRQLQLDVFGEVMDTLYQARRAGLPPSEWVWKMQRTLLDFLESAWSRPDEGIWEVRGPRRHFTHSKVMAWVAFDRAVRTMEDFGPGHEGPIERWRRVRDAIHGEVCTRGWDGALGSFVQAYGEPRLDASLLMMPLVGFLPATDPRMKATVAAIERGLMRDGLVARYAPSTDVDGLPPGEGTFLACSFWMADNYALAGRSADARRMFERLLALRNDVGLLAEEYDPRLGLMLGNFPQALSHLGVVNTAYNLTVDHHVAPAEHRSR